jgi:hypothetical protein
VSDFLNSFLPQGTPNGQIEVPRKMIIYGGFKIGKTALCEWLARNKRALWLDCEDGSLCAEPGWSVPGAGTLINIPATLRKHNAGREEKDCVGPTGFLQKLCSELAKEQPRRYDYVIADKLDTLEQWAERRATAYFKASPLGGGKNAGIQSVLELDKGGGYGYLRDQFNEIWNWLGSAAPRVLMIASLKASQIDKTISTVSSSELDLTGKVRKIAAGDADAVGFLFREKSDGANYLSFVTNDTETFAGSRVRRLAEKRFKLSWLKPDGTVEVDWAKLYPEPEVKP